MKTLQIIIASFAICFIGFIVYLAFLPVPPVWTGFGESIKDETKEAAKTLWDWLDLLIIPVVIGLLGWSFSQAEKVKTKKREEERTENEIFESFLQTMTDLIIKNNLHDEPTRQTLAIARARINVALNNINGARKGQILQFLYESYLVDINPKLKLRGANLKDAVLDEIVLGESEIRGAYFNKASIENANLKGAILVGCDFSQANLSNSSVDNVDLSYSNLTKAKLKNIDLTTVNFEGVTLTGADLRGSKILRTQLEGIFHKNDIKITKKKIV
jgi:uncharacterized protein YjbI with pentapeptide repeats